MRPDKQCIAAVNKAILVDVAEKNPHWDGKIADVGSAIQIRKGNSDILASVTLTRSIVTMLPFTDSSMEAMPRSFAPGREARSVVRFRAVKIAATASLAVHKRHLSWRGNTIRAGSTADIRT